jgi:DNA-binding protein HU-beta
MNSENIITKSGFIDHLKSNHAFKNNTEAKYAFESVIDSITKLLSSGHEINIMGFGKFEVKERSERDGRNLKTGEAIKIAAYKQPTFKAGTYLKASVNMSKKKTSGK